MVVVQDYNVTQLVGIVLELSVFALLNEVLTKVVGDRHFNISF